MRRRELLQEIERLRSMLETDPRLGAVHHELEVHREELETQNRQLIEAQRELASSRDRYADLFDFAIVPYLLLDNSGVVQNINMAAADLLGCERARIVGYPLNGFVDAPDRRRFLDQIAQCRRESRSIAVELVLLSRHGRRVPVHVTIKQWHASREGSDGFHMALIDLTERKAAEADRLQAAEAHQEALRREQVARAASEAKDRFLAILSHELRTPLTPILFALAAAERAGAIPADIASTVAMIRRNIELEARLIDDLLDITRITQGKLRLDLDLVDAHEVVREAIDLSQEQIGAAGLHVSTVLAATDRHVYGDATRLLQVLRNLLSNAIRNTSPGGQIVVGTATPRIGRVELTVADSGAGIAPEVLQRLFQPFEQEVERAGRSAGLGLGLAISRGIIEAHHGTIVAHSEGVGCGATFVVTLPAAAGQRVEPERAQAEKTLARSRSARVLLVEDNCDNAVAIAELLRVEGYEVTVADSVASALEKAQSGFDVLVSDIGLPDGSGRDLMRELSTRRSVRGIALTGYGTDEDVRLDGDAGFAAHLTKPVDPDKLIALIGDFTRRPPQRDQLGAKSRRVAGRRQRRSL
jgi:PAS domain S-box-containing protein